MASAPWYRVASARRAGQNLAMALRKRIQRLVKRKMRILEGTERLQHFLHILFGVEESSAASGDAMVKLSVVLDDGDDVIRMESCPGMK